MTATLLLIVLGMIATRYTNENGDSLDTTPAESLRLEATDLPTGFRFDEATTDLDAYGSVATDPLSGEIAVFGSDHDDLILVAIEVGDGSVAPEAIASMLVTGFESITSPPAEAQPIDIAGHPGAVASGSDGQVAISWDAGDHIRGLASVGLAPDELVQVAERSAGSHRGVAGVEGQVEGMAEVGRSSLEDAGAGIGATLTGDGASAVIYRSAVDGEPLIVSMAPGSPTAVHLLGILYPTAQLVSLRGTSGFLVEHASGDHSVTWVEADSTVVKVSGDVTRAELLATAEGLRAVTADRWRAMLQADSELPDVRPTHTGGGATDGVVIAGTTADGTGWLVRATSGGARDATALTLAYEAAGAASRSDKVDAASTLSAFAVRLDADSILLYGAVSEEVESVTTAISGSTARLRPNPPIGGSFPVQFVAGEFMTDEGEFVLIAEDRDGVEVGRQSISVGD